MNYAVRDFLLFPAKHPLRAPEVLDFVNNYAISGGVPGTASSTVATSRADARLMNTSGGIWSSVGVDTLRRSDAGALVEGIVTNSIRNSSGAGAVAGAPGTAPTNYGACFTQNNGLIRTMFASGTENGLPYVKVRLSGTPIISQAQTIIPEALMGIAGVQGETWSSTIIMSIEAGGNIAGCQWSSGISEVNGVGGLSTASLTEDFTPTVGSVYGSERFYHHKVLIHGDTVYTRNYLQCLVTLNVPIDFTLKVTFVYSKTPFPSSPINTTSATVTQAADDVTLARTCPTLGGVVITAVAPHGAFAQATLFSWDDATNDEQFRIWRDEGRFIHVTVTSGGVTQTELFLEEVADGAEFQVSFRWNSGAFSARVGDEQVVIGSGTMPVGLSTQRFGSDIDGNYWFGYIKRRDGYGSGFRLTGIVRAPGLWQQAAFRAYCPDDIRQSVAGTESVQTRDPIILTETPVSALRFSFAGFYADIDNNELDLGNDQQIEAALEITGAPIPVVRMTFNGQNIGVIQDGVAEYIADPVYPAQFGLTQFDDTLAAWIRQRRVVALGEYFNINYQNAGTGASAMGDNGSAPSQLMNEGLLAATGGSLAVPSYQGVFIPSAIVAPRADLAGVEMSWGLLSDSLPEGYGDALSGSLGLSGGHWQRGFYDVNGRSIPFIKFARGGTDADQYGTDMMTRRMPYFQYITHAAVALGTNGPVVAPPLTQWLLTLCGRLSHEGVGYIVVSSLYPRVATTPLWPVADQVPATNWETNGVFAYQFDEVWLPWLVGKCGIDDTIRVRDAVADATFPDRWKADDALHPTTADGTHASFLGYTLMAVPVKGYLEAL